MQFRRGAWKNLIQPPELWKKRKKRFLDGWSKFSSDTARYWVGKVGFFIYTSTPQRHIKTWGAFKCSYVAKDNKSDINVLCNGVESFTNAVKCPQHFWTFTPTRLTYKSALDVGIFSEFFIQPAMSSKVVVSSDNWKYFLCRLYKIFRAQCKKLSIN